MRNPSRRAFPRRPWLGTLLVALLLAEGVALADWVVATNNTVNEGKWRHTNTTVAGGWRHCMYQRDQDFCTYDG